MAQTEEPQNFCFSVAFFAFRQICRTGWS